MELWRPEDCWKKSGLTSSKAIERAVAKEEKVPRKGAETQRTRKVSSPVGAAFHGQLIVTENELSYEIIGEEIEVHRILEPGLLESAYEECMCYELKQRGFRIDQRLED
jgi:hypothetical protein